MSDLLKVCIIQREIQANDPAGNLFATVDMLNACLSQEVDLFVLTELFTTGIIENDESVRDDLAEDIDGPTITALREFCEENSVHLLAGSIPVKRAGSVTNTSVLVNHVGDVIAEYSKVHLFSPMGENEVFESGDVLAAAEIHGIGIGLAICYDLRFPLLTRRLAQAGCEVILVPALWPDARINHWEALLRARAIENQVYMVGANGIGNFGGNFFPGHSMIVSPLGESLNSPDMRESAIVRTLNISQLRNLRAQVCYLDDEIDVNEVVWNNEKYRHAEDK